MLKNQLILIIMSIALLFPLYNISAETENAEAIR